MLICVGIYVILFVLKVWRKHRKIFWLALLFNTIATFLFLAEAFGRNTLEKIERNSYGEGKRIESLHVSIEGEREEEIEVEVGEIQYTQKEIQEIFKKLMRELDEVILGENESKDRVETDLNLVEQIEGYPIRIQWEVSSYEVMDYQGHIIEEKTRNEGTLVELRGTLSYESEEAIYVTSVMVYPRKKTQKEESVFTVKKRLEEIEKETKKEKSFYLPDEVQGKKVIWRKRDTVSGYGVLLFGIVLIVLIRVKEKQDEKEEKQKDKEQMLRDYPDIICKFTLLIGTGMTVKNVWSKIVDNYEEQKLTVGRRLVYEEMCRTLREMQSGVPEVEAYERFGKRCGIVQYVKFGALLSQNIKKGSRGFVDILNLESIQAFENRKSIARKKGEEASTKLLLPMVGMLAVVMLMVIVPAFLSIRL